MTKIERYLCAGCEVDLRDAKIEHERVKSGGTSKAGKCDWCGRRCYGDYYEIRYGRD